MIGVPHLYFLMPLILVYGLLYLPKSSTKRNQHSVVDVMPTLYVALSEV